MSKSKYLFLVAIVLLAFSCKPTIPSRYLQPDELEDILYDYHLADAMAERDHNGEDMKYNKLLYRQAALKKHGITQADLDSSLVYYTRHSDKLHDIYENLTKRFSDEALALGASANEINQYGNITSDGDTANVWTGVKSVILTADAPYNVMTFNIKADTTYHKGDRIILNFNSDFVFKDGMRDANVMLAVQFSNDSVASNYMRISSNTKYNITVADKDRLGIKSVRGFFYLPKDNLPNQTAALRVLSITNINMVRFHNNEKPAEKPTTTATPKAPADTAKNAKPDTLKKPSMPSMPLPVPDRELRRTPDGKPLPPPAAPQLRHELPSKTKPARQSSK